MAQKSSILLSQDVQELVKKENKENRWKRRKRMAIWFLLFVPFTWIMGLKYGLSLEISFIAGYIYNTLHSHLVDFIMKYF